MDPQMKHAALGVAVALAGGSGAALAQQPVQPTDSATAQSAAKLPVQMSDAQLDKLVAGRGQFVLNGGVASRCNRYTMVNFGCC